MSPPSSTQFDQLVSVLLAGTISPAEHQQLEELLSTRPDLMDRYLEAVGLHLDLKQLASHPENRPTLHDPATAPRRRKLIRRAAGLTAAALMIAPLIFWVANENQRAAQNGVEQPVAQSTASTMLPPGVIIDEVASAKFFGQGLAPCIGHRLHMQEEYILTRGSLALKFPSGARAVLRAPSVFSADDLETLLLKSGQCSVHAPPGAEGFRVTTPSAKVVDLGTRFVVGVDVTGETSLHVVEGAAAVSADHATDDDSILLREGESIYLERDLPPQAVIPKERRIRYSNELPDRVIRYEATEDDDGLAEELLTLTVQRGGKIITYQRDDLNRGRLAHFRSTPGGAVFCTKRGDSLPEGEARLSLLSDWSLVTGIINPASNLASAAADRAGMEVEFDPPVVNGPGPDIVLFDLHLLVNSESGEMIRISTPESKAGGKHLDITQFDLDLSSPNALDLSLFQIYSTGAAIESLNDLVALPMQTRKQNFVRSKGIATGIDLSQLGYKPGEKVSRIILEDVFDDKQQIDPVLIVGLP